MLISFILWVGGFLALSIFNKHNLRVAVLNQYEKMNLQKENEVILDSIGEAVITFHGNEIKFINRKGMVILNNSVSHAEQSQREELMGEILNIMANRSSRYKCEDLEE